MNHFFIFFIWENLSFVFISLRKKQNYQTLVEKQKSQDFRNKSAHVNKGGKPFEEKHGWKWAPTKWNNVKKDCWTLITTLNLNTLNHFVDVTLEGVERDGRVGRPWGVPDPWNERARSSLVSPWPPIPSLPSSWPWHYLNLQNKGSGTSVQVGKGRSHTHVRLWDGLTLILHWYWHGLDLAVQGEWIENQLIIGG